MSTHADPFGARSTLESGGVSHTIWKIDATGAVLDRMPYTVKVLLENVLRNCGSEFVGDDDVDLARLGEPVGESVDERRSLRVRKRTRPENVEAQMDLRLDFVDVLSARTARACGAEIDFMAGNRQCRRDDEMVHGAPGHQREAAAPCCHLRRRFLILEGESIRTTCPNRSPSSCRQATCRRPYPSARRARPCTG